MNKEKIVMFELDRIVEDLDSEKITEEIKKGGKAIDVMWKDAKPSHREMAAKRKMIKMFLLDLYVKRNRAIWESKPLP